MLSKYFQQFLDDNDLQINERFALIDSDGKPQYINRKFWINKQNGGKLICDDKKIPATEVMMSLLRGNIFAKKLPWKPQNYDVYYYVTAGRAVEKTTFSDNFTLDCMLRNAGKCYRSYKEAEEHLEQDYKELVGESKDGGAYKE